VSAAALRRTPLYDRHVAAGARMVPFAGFELPVLYVGILEEHRAVRSGAGLFDVSHMGQIRLRGTSATALAQRVFTNDAVALRDGQVRYGLLCREDGGVIDDVTLYRRAGDDLFFCVNAANTRAVLAWLREVRAATRAACDVTDESDATALLAVQGPRARPLVHRLCRGEEPRFARFRFAERTLADVPVCLSRTGYTGEDGYEIYAPAARAGALWDALREAAGDALALAGLGARDTLRTEMAYPLYGHELDLEHDPLEAGLERFVAFGRGFIGEAELARRRARGSERRLVGLLLDGRQAARPGAAISDERGPVGVVTSGTYAPSVERAIAIGYVPARLGGPGTRLSVLVRGRSLPCEVCPTPFVHRKAG
jgi:aminomethyltransferase